MPIYLKPTVMLSAIIGAALGLVCLIPLLNIFVFLPFILIGGIIVYLLKRNNVIGVISINEGSIIGGIAGFISFTAAMTVFIPLSLILGLIFKTYLTASLISGASFMITSFNILVTVMLVAFIGMLNALLSAFSGLLVAFVYEKIEHQKILEEVPKFTIEQ